MSEQGDRFRQVLLQVAKDLLKCDLESLKYLCKEFEIGDAKLEEILQPLQLFHELENRGLLSADNKTTLAGLLGDIGRDDLKNKLLGIKDVPHSVRRTVPDAPLATGTITEAILCTISEDLGRDWKRLGRKLEVKETIIENIEDDSRRVKARAFQVMLQWKRKNGVNASAQVLADALTYIGRKDVAETLAAEVQCHTGPMESLPTDLRAALPVQEEKNPANGEKKTANNEKGLICETDSSTSDITPRQPMQEQSTPDTTKNS